MGAPVIVAGKLTGGVWCPGCNAPVRIRFALHHGSTAAPVAAHVEVCVSCGHHYIPAMPVVQVIPQVRPWWRHRPRPALGWLWWLHRRQSARAGRTATGCAWPGCPRPGWFGCAWFQAVDDGRIRWVFCGRRHRRYFLADQQHADM